MNICPHFRPLVFKPVTVRLLLSLLSLLILAVPLRASETIPDTVRVAYSRDSVPFHFTNTAGEPDGMVIDKWKLWSQKTGIPIDFIPASWVDTLSLVKNGRADVHAGLFFNAARDAFLDYGLPMFKTDTHLFYDKRLPYPDGIEAFSAYRIGVIEGDFVVTWLNTHMPALTLVKYNNYTEMMTALNDDEIMVFAADTLTGLHYLGKSGLRRQFRFNADNLIYRNNFIPAVKQGNTALLNVIMEGMDKISKTESAAIARRWASGTKEEDSSSLIIAIDREYPPLTLVDPQGNPGGMLVDMWRLWSKATGLKIKFRPSSWAESIEAVRNGSADIHSGLFKSNKRSRWMAFSNPIHRAQTALYFNTGESQLPLEQLSGQRVGVLSGSFQEKWIHENYPDIRTVYCADGEELILTLLKKNVQAIFHETMAVEADLSRLGVSGNLKKGSHAVLSNAIYAGIPKRNKDLLQVINKGLAAIPREELADLEIKWIPRKKDRFYAGEHTAFTRAEKEFIANHHPLRFSEVDWRPLSILDDTNDFKGMIADYLDVITRKSGLKFTFSPSDTWAEVLNRYKAKTIDLVPALGKNDRIDREINLSRPFVSFPLVIVTRDDVNYMAHTSQLKGRKVAVGKNYTSYHYLTANHPEIELVQTDDVKSGLMALANRRVDAFVGHMAVVVHTIQENALTNLKIAGETEYSFDHCMGVSPQYPQAVSIINKVLDGMTDEEHRNIYRKWLSVHYEKKMDYRLIAAILTGAFLFLGIIVYWNRILAREIKERKRTEVKLLETEKKTRAMSEAIHDGLVMIDDKARVMYWNHAAETLFDIPSDEAMGRDMHALFAPEKYRVSAKKGLKTFAQTGQGPVVGQLQELTAQRKDGTTFPVEVGVSPFQMENKWYAVGSIRDITERNRTQETVQKIRTELQQIFDNAHVGILFLKGRRKLYRCNTRTAEILGYASPNEMIGMNMIHLHLSEENFNIFGERFYSRLARGELVRSEYELKQKNGAGIWCSLSGRALDPASPPDMKQGVIWVIDDISEKYAAQQALKESEKRVRTILDFISTGIMIIDPEDHTIKDVNPAAAEMIGLPREKIIGRICHNFVCPNEINDCPIIDNRQSATNDERILLTADGREIPILKTVIQVELDGKPQILESFVALTEQKKAEKELQKNLTELERFYQLAIGREQKMINLKAEINRLLLQTGQDEKYIIR